MAKDKELKCIVPASKDDSFGRQSSTEIRYSVKLKAEKKDGVFGFRGLPTKTTYLSLPTSKSNNPHRGE